MSPFDLLLVLVAGGHHERPDTMDYLSFYGLNESPFLIAPNPRFLYMSAQHKTALAKVVSKLQTRQGLSLVYGAAGTGKTTVARWLHDRLNDDPSGLYVARTLY